MASSCPWCGRDSGMDCCKLRIRLAIVTRVWSSLICLSYELSISPLAIDPRDVHVFCPSNGRILCSRLTCCSMCLCLRSPSMVFAFCFPFPVASLLLFIVVMHHWVFVSRIYVDVLLLGFLQRAAVPDVGNQHQSEQITMSISIYIVGVAYVYALTCISVCTSRFGLWGVGIPN